MPIVCAAGGLPNNKGRSTLLTDLCGTLSMDRRLIKYHDLNENQSREVQIKLNNLNV